MAKNDGWYLSDESRDEVRPKKIVSDVEEGEVSSDDDEANIDKLFKTNEDKKRLQNMTEKEREEEIFKRSMELNDIKSRQKAAKKLSELKKKEDFNKPPNKKRSIEDIFRDSDGDSIKSFSSNDSAPKKKSKTSPLYDRQKALDSQKQSKKKDLNLLHKNVKQRKEKIEKLQKEEAKTRLMIDSDTSDVDEKKIKNVERQSNLSSSDSENGEEPEESVEDKVVDTLDQLNKIRVSRHKLEKWVHMPFFENLIKGCYVRVNIGEGPSVMPIYRIAEITGVVETVKIYDLGNTRTNVGLKLRIGKSVTTFRLLFVSNQNFLETEFDSWRRRVNSDGFPLPKLSFIEEKAKKLGEYSNFSIKSEDVMKQVLQSKQRFQKGPVNCAMRKAELTRMKLAAEDDGDMTKAGQLQDEIDELNMKMEKLERKRTEGIKNISYINQRNRENTDRDIEKAIALERQENLEWEKKGGDPFVREATKPVLNHRKRRHPANVKTEEQSKTEEEKIQEAEQEAAAKVLAAVKKEEEAKKALEDKKAKENKLNISNIHNFELNLDIDVDSARLSKLKESSASQKSSVVTAATLDLKGSILDAINNSCISGTAVASTGAGNSRRVLDLNEYKRRKGLI